MIEECQSSNRSSNRSRKSEPTNNFRPLPLQRGWVGFSGGPLSNDQVQSQHYEQQEVIKPLGQSVLENRTLTHRLIINYKQVETLLQLNCLRYH